MAVKAQNQTPANIDTPDVGWSELFYDDGLKRWCQKKDDGSVKCFSEQGDETLTTLQLNANILKYTDENGADTDIDLTLYLDDTNLARLTSGTINPSTGIATFTRDDLSTFTVDFSSLIDIETVTTLTESPSGVFEYTSEDATKTTIDISNFETSTELNARDTANRSRANHTGTQLAVTISDLTTRIKTDETTTGLALNVNSLDYTDEDGVTTNIDLSPYIDDTNLSRITSASLNPTTFILTFTRDDLSTFTVDLSGLDNASAITNHINDLANPHAVTKAQVGLSNVPNVDATARANHTGTQLASTVSDFDIEVANNTAVTANTAKVTNATHTGEVTGSGALTLSATAISNKTLDVSLTGSEEVLINDGGLKKTTTQDIADLSSASSPPSYESNATSFETTSSGTYVDVATTTLTPPSGKYLILLSAQLRSSASNGLTFMTLGVNGSAQTSEERHMEGTDEIPTSAQFIHTANGTTVFTIMIKKAGGGDAEIMERSIIMIKVQ